MVERLLLKKRLLHQRLMLLLLKSLIQHFLLDLQLKIDQSNDRNGNIIGLGLVERGKWGKGNDVEKKERKTKMRKKKTKRKRLAQRGEIILLLNKFIPQVFRLGPTWRVAKYSCFSCFSFLFRKKWNLEVVDLYSKLEKERVSYI